MNGQSATSFYRCVTIRIVPTVISKQGAVLKKRSPPYPQNFYFWFRVLDMSAGLIVSFYDHSKFCSRHSPAATYSHLSFIGVISCVSTPFR